jgi:hypothetical protein
VLFGAFWEHPVLNNALDAPVAHSGRTRIPVNVSLINVRVVSFEISLSTARGEGESIEFGFVGILGVMEG